MIEAGPDMPEERFLALTLGEELFGWNTKNLPAQAVDAAIDARPDLIRAAKRIAEIVRMRDHSRKRAANQESAGD